MVYRDPKSNKFISKEKAEKLGLKPLKKLKNRRLELKPRRKAGVISDR